jgi:hypothetical protein
MKIFQVMYDEVTVGIVADPSGSHTSDDALQAWNTANPSYAGDSARETEFVTL